MPDEDLAQFVRPWLQYAPKPPPRGPNSYDAFISYRSSDRPWAMALFDALKPGRGDVGEAFLDQYDLVPRRSQSRETSLSEALRAGEFCRERHPLVRAGPKTPKWCERERNSMRFLADRPNSSSFKYIFGKLDAEDLPLFAQADLYVGFEDSLVGPRGVNLLRLMCGMRGMALPPEAVVMAQQVDVDAKQAMVQINGAIEGGNATKLVGTRHVRSPGTAGLARAHSGRSAGFDPAWKL